MDITEYVDILRKDLVHAAQAMGPELEQAAERLSFALDSSARLALMDALSHAAAEITNELDGTSVEVRLQGREPVFVVVRSAPATAEPASEDLGDDDGETARITLRLPESLKSKAEELASTRGQSLNTWLVAAVRAATAPGLTINVGPFGASVPTPPGRPGRIRTNKRVQGWVR
ncbi:MAG: histidine kinase [Intrasporangium sp.]|uniref:histidine kinase n=1 Tax=Intrasporangium sp. TaxID=1925024 RepID=UPI002647C51E|nr:histidine kinase [Intrasporangium sp.]MDN5798142.1 histidine kinase [Intrasporangium sp.]